MLPVVNCDEYLEIKQAILENYITTKKRKGISDQRTQQMIDESNRLTNETA